MFFVEVNITDEIARGLRLLEIKVRRNITDASFKEIITAANGVSTSVYILTRICGLRGTSSPNVQYFGFNYRFK